MDLLAAIGFVSFSLLADVFVEGVNWCDRQLYCNIYGDFLRNTGCEYNVREVDRNDCKRMRDVMNSDDKAELLGVHNGMRDRLAASDVTGAPGGWPKAANMRQITWDDDLAELATIWAFQCINGPDLCRKTPNFLNHKLIRQVGGDISHGTKYLNAMPIYQFWLNDIFKANPRLVHSYTHYDYSARFFTIMWADIYKMGCGFIHCNYRVCVKYHETKHHKHCVEYGPLYVARLVCNYAPAGLTKGSSAWIPGKPCSRCPPGTKCNPNSTYPNLCALPTDPIHEPPYYLPVWPSSASQSPPKLLVVLLLLGWESVCWC